MLPIILCLVALSLLCSGILLSLVFKLSGALAKSDEGSLAARCDSLEAGQKRLEELLRVEMAQNRRETSDSLAQNRDALVAQVNGISNAMHELRSALGSSLNEVFGKQRETQGLDAKKAREELGEAIKAQGELLLVQHRSAVELQTARIEATEVLLRKSSEKSQSEAGLLRDGVIKALEALKIGLIEKMDSASNAQRSSHAAEAKIAREETASGLRTQGEALLNQIKGTGEQQRERLETMKEFLTALVANHRTEAKSLRENLATALENINTLLREQTRLISKGQTDQTAVLSKGQVEQTAAVTQTLDSFAAKVRDFEGRTGATLEKMRGAVEQKLGDLQQGNEKKLEEMRVTVDEKLQGTLEKRLGQSFQLVSDQLEQVQRGLGEMQSLANGVGDLKKVLSNVKTRGNWGEVQLGNLLDQVMSPEQFSTNVAVTNGRERVEFAIKLPGRDDSQPQIWLPIDAKFPQETYARLIAAEEAGDLEGRDRCSKELEEVVKRCAGDICRKYISPPLTTDFAVLYLPTEGLYAEVVKRTGVIEHLHRECRVVIAGPTTIAALLNSLQMGFRTLEIQKNSSQINEVLVSVKTEFGKYTNVLDKIKKNLETAQRTIDDAQQRTRVLTRTLDKIEAVEDGSTSRNLVLSAAEPVVEALEMELAESD